MSLFAAALPLLFNVPAARAQCYVFSSSAAGISVTANITITSQTINNITPGQTRFTTFNYTGSYTETIGNLTLVGNGPQVNATIGYVGIPGTVPWTSLIMGSGGLTSNLNNGVMWAVSLNGTGDLLPNGITPVLPPISAWQYNPGAGLPVPGNQLTIYANGVTVTKMYDVTIDGIASCNPSGKSPATSPTPGCVACGDPPDPINVGTGNLFEEFHDYRTSGPNQLAFTRYYNSMSALQYSRRFARCELALHLYDRYLILNSATSVTAERADGQQLTFTLTGGAWTIDADIDIKLTNSGTTWTLTDINDAVEETYKTVSATEAQLDTIRARNG